MLFTRSSSQYVNLGVMEKDMLSPYSPSVSTISFDDEKSSERSISIVETIPPPIVLPESRSFLGRRACNHLRRLCRNNSPEKVQTTPTLNDLEFSYAIIPSALAFQYSADAAAETKRSNAAATALIIECNDVKGRIQQTLESALRVFPGENIFVVGNSASESATNRISMICAWFGIHYIWLPTRSKVAAQYVGVVAAHDFKYCLLINDDVPLPPNFHVVTDWIETHKPDKDGSGAPVKCIGYAPEPTAIKDLQIQDLRYRLSSIPSRFFQGPPGSLDVGTASFPEGEVSLWDRRLLEDCFQRHPGYKGSPNWFLGVNLALVLQKSSIDKNKQRSKSV